MSHLQKSKKRKLEFKKHSREVQARMEDYAIWVAKTPELHPAVEKALEDFAKVKGKKKDFSHERVRAYHKMPQAIKESILTYKQEHQIFREAMYETDILKADMFLQADAAGVPFTDETTPPVYGATISDLPGEALKNRFAGLKIDQDGKRPTIIPRWLREDTRLDPETFRMDFKARQEKFSYACGPERLLWHFRHRETRDSRHLMVLIGFEIKRLNVKEKSAFKDSDMFFPDPDDDYYVWRRRPETWKTLESIFKFTASFVDHYFKWMPALPVSHYYLCAIHNTILFDIALGDFK